MTRHQPSPMSVKLTRALSVVGVAAIAWLAAARSPAYHSVAFSGDESGFAAATMRLPAPPAERDARERDLSETDLNYSRRHPQLWLYGLGAVIHAYQRIDTGPNNWDRTVLFARRVSSTLFALGVVFLFLAVRLHAESTAAGLAAAALTIANPIARSLATSILPEVPMFFFCALSLYGIAVFVARPRPSRRQLSLALGIGLSMGLAISSKLYAVTLLPLLPLAATLHRGREGDAPGLRPTTAVALAASAVVFFVANPLLWSRPIGASMDMTVRHMDFWRSVGYFRIHDAVAPYLALVPLLFMAPLGYSLEGSADRFVAPSVADGGVWLVFCVVLAALGIVRCGKKPFALWLIWWLLNLGLTLFVVGPMDAEWLSARVFFLTSVSLGIVAAHAFVKPPRRLFDAPREAP